MEWFVRSSFLFSSIINLAPVVGVLDSKRLLDLYEVSIQDENTLLMLRHRACLFAVVSGILGISVVHKPFRCLGYIVGISSMASYIALAATATGGLSSFTSKIQRVYWIDVVGVLWLGSAAVASYAFRHPIKKGI